MVEAAQIERKRLAEEQSVSTEELANYLGVQKKALEDFLKAYGYDPSKSIGVKEFKGLMVKSGLSYVDSKWYRTKMSDADSIFEFLESFDKEKRPRASLLSAKLEGSMLLAAAAKTAGLGEEEIFNLVAKKANVERVLEVYDGRRWKDVPLTVAQHLGIAYMGINEMNRRFESAEADRLTGDFTAALAGMMKGAKDAGEVVQRLKNSPEFEGLIAGLAIESAQVLKGEKYDGKLKEYAAAVSRELEATPGKVIETAKRINPKFGDKLASKLDDEDELNDFRRYFSSTYMVRCFLDYQLGPDKIKGMGDYAAYSYLLATAAEYASDSREGREAAKRTLDLHNNLSDKLAYVSGSNPAEYYKLEDMFLGSILSKKADVDKLADETMTRYSKVMGLDPKTDKNVAWFFSPEVIAHAKDAGKMHDALNSALGYFGFDASDLEKIKKGQQDDALYSKLKASAFYMKLGGSAYGYKDEEVMQAAVNFLGSAAEIYLAQGQKAKEFLDETVAQVPSRSKVMDEYRGRKENEKLHAVNSVLWSMWRYADARLEQTEKVYTFNYRMEALSDIKAAGEKAARAAAMLGLDIKWMRDEWMLWEKDVEQAKKSQVYQELQKKGFAEGDALTVMAGLVYPSMVLLDAADEATVREGILQYIRTHDKAQISAKAISDDLQELPAVKSKTGEAKKEAETRTARLYREVEVRIAYNKTRRAWALGSADELGSSLLIGDMATDANMKHWENEMRARFGGLDEKALRRNLKGGKYGGIPEMLAITHAGPKADKTAAIVTAYMKKLKDEYRNLEDVRKLAKENDSVYDAFLSAAEKIVDTRFAFLGKAEKDDLKRRFFLSDIAVMHGEYGVRGKGVTVEDVNKAIKSGGTETLGGEEMKRIITKTIRPAKGETYTLWHLKENGERAQIGTYADGTAKVDNGKINWNIGDTYCITHGQDKLDAWMPALYYHYRRRNNVSSFMVNGSINAEMTLLNLRARDNPFDITGKKSVEVPQAPEAVPAAPVEVPELVSRLQRMPAVELTPIELREPRRTGRKSLQFVGVPSPMVGISVPVISKEVIVTTIPGTTTFTLDAEAFGGRFNYFDQTNELLMKFGYSDSKSTGTPDMDMLRDNFEAFTLNQLASNPATMDIARNGGSLWVYTDASGNPIITGTAPASGTFGIEYRISGGTFTAYAGGQEIATGTVTVSEETGQTTTKITGMRAPVFLTLNNLVSGQLPYGFQYSAGTKVAFQFMYDMEKKLPKEYLKEYNFYPFLTLSRPINLGEGFVANPYVMGMWDVSGGAVHPLGGLTFTKTTQGNVVGFSLSGGVGLDLSDAKNMLPHLGAGLSVYGVHVGGGVNVKKFDGPLYVELGYDMNRDGVMDYGLRMMNSVVWIPDVVIDGQGIVSTAIGWVGSGIKGAYRKIKGQEAM